MYALKLHAAGYNGSQMHISGTRVFPDIGKTINFWLVKMVPMKNSDQVS